MSAVLAPPAEDYVNLLEALMMRVAWDEYRRSSRELSAHELTLAQFHTLVAIKQSNLKCTMGRLADETNQVSATVTGIIDRLVERGFVKRAQHPDDRRKVLVQLTDAGQSKVNEVFHARRDHVNSIVDQLDEPTCHHLTFSLKRYLDLLETAKN